MKDLLSQVSEISIAFGGASISGEGGGYGFGDVDESKSIELVQNAFDKGIRIFDTAPIYGFGTSEKRLGKALKDVREKSFIISKSGVTWNQDKRVDMSNTPEVTLKMLEQSLRDLNTDYIDLYMIHWPDEKVDIRKPLEVLSKAKQQGKIKNIGLCNTFREDIDKASEIDKIEVVQSQLNIFERDSLDLFDYIKERNMSFMSWGTFEKGIITYRVVKDRVFDKSDCRSWAPWWKKSNKDQKIEVMSDLKQYLDENNCSGAELALAHNVKYYNDFSTALVGTKNIDQLDSLLAAYNNMPSRDVVEYCINYIDSKMK